MLRALLSILLLTLADPGLAKERPSKEPAPALTGSWTFEGAPYAEFRADGACWVGQAAGKWKADGKTLVLSYDNGAREVMEYRLSGSSLTVTMNGKTKTLARGLAKPEDDAQLVALLMSAPWCYASRDEVSGKTRRERLAFSAGGAWSSGRGAAPRSGSWQVRGGRLWMSRDEAPLKSDGNSISRDANGYPIVRLGKKEYSQCR